MFASLGSNSLECHSASRCAAVNSLAVTVSVLPRERLRLTYELDADLARLRIPSEQPAHRAEELWTHSCFEAFLKVKDVAAYSELNFAPSHAWAVYRFSARRAGMAVVSDARAPEITVRRTAAGLTLAATLFWHDLIGAAAPLVLRMGVAAVLEDDSGRLSYWALRHPPGKPDFHHPDSFTLELAL